MTRSPPWTCTPRSSWKPGSATVLKDTTTLIVAHRPSTVALADRVALLEEGRIAAVGTHTELLAHNPHYRYVIASLDQEPRDLDSELSELEEAAMQRKSPDEQRNLRHRQRGQRPPQQERTAKPYDGGRSPCLAQLIRPVRLRFWLTIAMVVLSQAARVAGPALIAFGIDHALPALQAGDNLPLVLTGVAYLLAAIATAGLTSLYVTSTARLSQAMLLDLRVRVFRHTQRLSLEFHEKYTSGRIIARQTSDLEALRELLDSGVSSLASGLLFMVFTAITRIRPGLAQRADCPGCRRAHVLPGALVPEALPDRVP